MRSDVYEKVQAALLDSDGESEVEVQQALKAVLEFAKNEFDATDKDLQEWFDDALALLNKSDDDEDDE